MSPVACQLHQNCISRMAKAAPRPRQRRVGRNGHQVPRQHRGMWLSAAGQLYRVCKEIRVRSTVIAGLYADRPSFLTFNRYSHVGEPFPCYFSRAYPEMVVARYSWDDNLKHLILSLIIPNVLFAVSIGVLSYWYCPCCDKACHKSPRVYAEKYPTKEK